jgi:hypothetical protein
MKVSYRQSGSRRVTPRNVEVIADDCHLGWTETFLAVNLFGHDRDSDFNKHLFTPF